MKKIIYTRPDGGVSVVSPAPAAQFLSETEDEFLARIQAKDVPSDAINPQIVDESTIPADRTFRNALRQNGSILIHDMPTCRQIQEQRMETSRRIKMHNLLMREELGENVAAEKAVLRAINARALCQAAQTPEELKAAMPDILK